MSGTKLNGRWSLKHDMCTSCHETSSKHHGKGVCNTCYSKELRDKNPVYKKDSYERTRLWNRKMRAKALNAYSPDIIPRCACCKENTEEFLVIDHVDNNGSTHRKVTGGSGSHTYVWLYKHNYPKGFQVLCFNCNMGKQLYGICPHQKPNMGVEVINYYDKRKVTPKAVPYSN